MAVKLATSVLLSTLFFMAFINLSHASEEIEDVIAGVQSEDNQEFHDDTNADDVQGRWGYHRRPSYGHHHSSSNSISSSKGGSYSYQHHGGNYGGGHGHHQYQYQPSYSVGHGSSYGSLGSQKPISHLPTSIVGDGYDDYEVQHRPGGSYGHQQPPYGGAAGAHGNHRPIGAAGLGGAVHFGQLDPYHGGLGKPGQQSILKGPAGYGGIAQDQYNHKKEPALHAGHGLIAGPSAPIVHDNPRIQFTSVGPNGRPAVSYTSKNFGFYFRNKNAADSHQEEGDESLINREEQEPDSSAVQF